MHCHDACRRSLDPWLECRGRILKNTNNVVKTMEEVTLNENEMFVIYDVKSLFTCILVEELIGICE